ncbi:MAG: hypothetical protein YK1309IOTA_2090002 [Marine Group I thaumarchaeote]|nr:MAG: hypothetical protein YK1309IOTA_2090002 [Marine Group I thaumarchaeote]
MTKTSQQVKTMISDWFDSIGVTHEEIKQKTDEKTTSIFEFMILSGPEKQKMSIYTLKKIPDRLIIQAEIGLGEDHKKITVDMGVPKFSAFIINLQDKFTTYDIRYRFLMDGKQLNAIRLHKFIHYEVLDKEKFMQTYARVAEIFNTSLNLVSAMLGVAPPKPEVKEDDDTQSPYG